MNEKLAASSRLTVSSSESLNRESSNGSKTSQSKDRSENNLTQSLFSHNLNESFIASFDRINSFLRRCESVLCNHQVSIFR